MLSEFGWLDKHYSNTPELVQGATFVNQNGFWTCLALGHRLFDSQNVRPMDYVFKDFYENFQREVYWNEQTFYYRLNRLTDHLMAPPAEQTMTPIGFPYPSRPLDPNEGIDIRNQANTQTIPQQSPQVEPELTL